MSWLCNCSRKYVQRQKSLKKAFSWWEDEDENPDIAYKDFSRRKLLFDFGAHRNRRKSDVSICTFKMDQVGNVLKIKSKLDFVLQGNNSPDGVLEALPSQLLRKWKRASKMLNVACVLTKLPHRERWINSILLKFKYFRYLHRSCSDPEVDTTEVDKMKIHPGK